MNDIKDNINILPYGAFFNSDGSTVFRLCTFETTTKVTLKVK